jgi:hypothetical protein
MRSYGLRTFFTRMSHGTLRLMIDDDGQAYLHGTILISDLPTHNGRVYSREILTKAIEEAKHKTIVGGLNVAWEEDRLPPEKISHVVTDMSLDDNRLNAKLKILDTQAGRTLKELVESRAQLEAFTLGYGQLQSNANCSYTVTEFELLGVNVVGQHYDY